MLTDAPQAQNVRITENEMDLLEVNKTNLVKVTGDDYLGIVGIYHHIHCLNNIRRLLHWDYYGAKFGKDKHLAGFTIEHTGKFTLAPHLESKL
jgi:hypothetical protein